LVQLHILLFTASLLLAALAIPFLAQAQVPNTSGHFITREGRTVTFSRLHSASQTIRFTYGSENKATGIPLADVRRIIFGDDQSSAVVYLKDGREVSARNVKNGENHDYLAFHYFDEIAKTENYNRIAFSSLSEIIVEEHAGQFRRCPHCNAVWPDKYLFCPHDGTKTNWGER
jgi:NADH pyrophosphatase NudC (nudix superfamily)